MMPLQVLISGLLLLLPGSNPGVGVVQMSMASLSCIFSPRIPLMWKQLEVIPTQPSLKISIKDLYIGISVSAALLILLASALTIIKCRHRKKKTLESSVVFHGFQNEVFQSAEQSEAVDTVDIIKVPVAI